MVVGRIAGRLTYKKFCLFTVKPVASREIRSLNPKEANEDF
jgi:hypothetical protein